MIGLRKTLILIALFLVLIISSLVVYYMNRDSDNDGIPDLKEKEYGTDPNKPNYLLAYALKKLPEKEALRFKNVENFDESSKGLVDLYSSLSQDKRSSKEVNMILDKILSDNVIDETEKNLFDDRFVNPTLPSIDNLSWAPTRENLDKIYDINVTFVAKDDKTPIAYAELHFVPVEYTYMIEKYGMRPEDYPKVFPPDKERDFVLTPVDGKFDSLEERFSVPIKDIVGGREYKIVALVRDSAGNERTVEIKTPYIRQFENLGKLFFDKKVIVSTVYMPWDMKNIPMKEDEPLLGRYDASDDIVQFKHIDWATGHGINVFWVSSNLESSYEVSIIEKLLSKGGIKVGVMLGPDARMTRGGMNLPDWAIDLNNPKNSEILMKIIKSIANLCNNSNYFKIDGKIAIYIWDEGAFFNQHKTYSEIRNVLKNITGFEPFVIAGAIPGIPVLPIDDYFNYLLTYRGEGWQLVNCFTGWIGFHSPSLDNVEFVRNYELYLPQHIQKWKDFAKENRKCFVHTVTPGFDNSYSWGGPQIPLPRSPEKFAERLELTLNFLDNGYKEVRIDTWNDFGEWSYIEPTEGEGFSYLEVLRDILEEYKSKA